MIYDNIKKASFKSRPNRFIAYGQVDGIEEKIHVKNTGRCRELLVPKATIYLQHMDSAKRKTQWDLIAVEKGSRLINMDSQAPNQVVKEFIEDGRFFENGKKPGLIKPEFSHGDSRFDFYLEQDERKILIEVKGVTLENKGVAMFPDAPSERALKHIRGLEQAVDEGFEAYVFFVIQMEHIRYFTPNKKMHPAFATALKEAKKAGVNLLAYDCKVEENSLMINEEVEILLEGK